MSPCRSLAVSIVACLLLSGPFCARAADPQYSVFFDGSRADKRGPSGLEHRGTTYISAVRAVSVFDGFLNFGKGGNLVEVTIDHRTMNFIVGNKIAYLDGMRVALPAPPIKIAGDVYLPLATIARLGSARVSVDRRKKIVSFKTGDGVPFPDRSAGPAKPLDAEDVQPSPAQALAIVTTVSFDATGMHARAAVRNKTIKEYTLSFPTAKQLAFVVTRDGSEVWDSTAKIADASPSAIVIGPLETKIVTADDPDFGKLGTGRFQLRVRLMTAIPLDLPPISLDDVPSPAPSR